MSSGYTVFHVVSHVVFIVVVCGVIFLRKV
jgi:hypothetical protein